MLTAMIRRLFQFLIVRAPRNRFAAIAAMLVALFFARRLMRTAATRQAQPHGGDQADAETQRGRVIDGEYHRVDTRQ